MARPRRTAHPWTLRILEILAEREGEWFDYEEIVALTAPMVPPGMAWRAAEQRRALHYKRQGLAIAERQHGGRADTIKTGQRSYIRIAINGLATHNRVEVMYGDQPKRPRPIKVRLLPGALGGTISGGATEGGVDEEGFESAG